MSKHPSPRLDQLRALREAKFARSLQSQRAEEKPAAPAKRAPAIVQEPAPAAPAPASLEPAPAAPAPASLEPAPAAPAKKPAAKKKAAAKPAAKKKAKKKAG